jgi:hypothetical protein
MALMIYTDVLQLTREMRGVLGSIGKHDADLARQTRQGAHQHRAQRRGGELPARGQPAAAVSDRDGSADEVRACLEISAALDYIADQPVLIDAFDRVARTLFKRMR